MIELLIALGLFWPQDMVGVATYYTYDDYGGGPLYCSTVDNPMWYTRERMEQYNWVAVDPSLYKTGLIKCGDLVELEFESGELVRAYAWDAGPLYDYRVMDWPSMRIIVDLEESAWPKQEMSGLVRMRIANDVD